MHNCVERKVDHESIAAYHHSLHGAKLPRYARGSALTPRHPSTKSSTRSEHELMRELALRQAPRCLEVFREVFCLLDSGNDGLVNLLLVGGLGLGECLLGLGLAFLKELLLGRLLALDLSLGEVGIGEFLIKLQQLLVYIVTPENKSLTNRELGEIKLGGGGNNICLVYPPKGNTVDLEGTGDK
jgi:hypothetical protein